MDTQPKQPTNEEIQQALREGHAVSITRKCPMCNLVLRFLVTKPPAERGLSVEFAHELPACEWAESHASNDWIRNALFGPGAS